MCIYICLHRADVWKTPIDAKHNYWGFNETLAVSGRIKDRLDEQHLLEVDFIPFHMNNKSVLSGKCPPGWDLVGDTCYIYVGAPMTFSEAREFCKVCIRKFDYEKLKLTICSGTVVV